MTSTGLCFCGAVAHTYKAEQWLCPKHSELVDRIITEFNDTVDRPVLANEIARLQPMPEPYERTGGKHNRGHAPSIKSRFKKRKRK